MYNLTNVTDNANDLYQVVKGVNDLSNGLLISSILIILFLTFIMVNKKENFKVVLLAASFFITIISVFAFAMKLIGINYLIVPIVILLASIIIYLFVEDR